MPKRIIPLRVADSFPGSEFHADEIEFAFAMEAYQRRYHRRYPAWSEVLYVARQLGYRRDPPAESPQHPNTPYEKRLCSASPDSDPGSSVAA